MNGLTATPYTRLRRLAAGLRSHPWLGEAVAVVVFIAAFGLRVLLDNVLPPGFPFLTFFPAVILTTFFCGLRPGIICAVLSGVAAWYAFLPPFNLFALSGPTAIALAFYTFIVTVDIALIHFMHQAGDRLQKEQAVSAALYDQQYTMFQELQHRVANNMQFVASLLVMQKRKAGEDPQAAIAALDDARIRLETISRIHRRLYDPERLSLPVGHYLQELCSDLIEATGAANVVCLVDSPPVRFDITQLTTLSLLVVEIVTNALKHAFTAQEKGTITINLEQLDSKGLLLRISDDGRGMPSDFDPATSKRLGFRISQNLAAQLGGSLKYNNATRTRGTEIRCAFVLS